MDWIDALLPALEHFRPVGYAAVAVVSFLESLAFVGLLVPGTVFLVVVGGLAAAGVFDLPAVFWCSVAGALLGDGLSYELGKRGEGLFRHGNRLLKPGYLEVGQRFFEKHGGKSVFLGRFLGPVRPIVPFVAGVTRMPIARFYGWNLLSALLWSATYLTLGAFLGHGWRLVRVWSTRAGLLIVALILVALLFYGVTHWFLRNGRRLVSFLGSVVNSAGRAIAANEEVERLVARHPRLWGFLAARLRTKEFTGLPLTLFGVAFGYVLLLFLGVAEDLLTRDPIVALDVRLENLLQSLRDDTLVTVFLWVTLLGKATVVIPLALALTLIAWVWRRGVFALSGWICLGGASLLAWLGKSAFRRPRPLDVGVYAEPSFSFPSGHAAVAVAFYGFVAYALAKSLRAWSSRVNMASVWIALVLAVGFSRMYLGVHYLSDVLGGYLLGALWLIAAVALVEWRTAGEATASGKATGRCRIWAVTAFLLVPGVGGYVYQGLKYHPAATPSAVGPTRLFEPGGPVETIRRYGMPTHTETILGTPQEPLSLFVVTRGESHLQRAMELAGWVRADAPAPSSLLRLAGAVLEGRAYPSAPITPSFWNARPHDVAFEKPTAANSPRERHHARFWRTDFVGPSGQLYVGTASFDQGLRWGLVHFIAPAIDEERDRLASDLRKSGQIAFERQVVLVAPEVGVNFLGDPFFTDGKAREVSLKP